MPARYRCREAPAAEAELGFRTVLSEPFVAVLPTTASVRRIGLKGLAFRRIEPISARTRVAVAWRTSANNPLATHLLATVSQEPRDVP